MTTLSGCPACGAGLVSERGAAPWCERCAWGIDVYGAPEHASWLARRTGAVTHRIAYRLTMAQFNQLAKREGSGPFAPVRPGRRWSRVRVVVIVFALLFYALIAAMAVAGVWLVLFDFPNLSIVPGLLLLGIAAHLAPRFGRLPRHADILRRDEAPTLFGLVDRVAAAAGTPAPHVIVVDPEFNASAGAVGLRRRRVLTLGLTLWGALEPQQRVALLAHEMGHFSNGDVRRGLFTQPAMTTLDRLAALFAPNDRYLWGGGWLYEKMANALSRAVGAAIFVVHLGVLAVVLRDSHRAEYLADQRATRLAGTRATVALFDLFNTSVAATIASLARRNETERSWRAAAAESMRTNAPRRNRLRQLSTRTDVSLWTVHPPHGLRAWLVEGAAYQDPSFVLGEDESERIDAELRRYYDRYRRVLAESGV